MLMIVLLALAGASDAGSTTLGIEGGRFTINSTPTFLLGFSYYAGLGAPPEHVRQDLDDFRDAGFNWLRVFATLSVFEDTSAVDAAGRPREPYLGRLKALLSEADRRGMVVDVTLARGVSLPDHAAHRKAVETLTKELEPWRNAYFDLANERDLPGGGFVSLEDIADLARHVKQLDPARLLTASDCDPDRADLQAALAIPQLDFLSPHRWRDPSTVRSSRAWTEQTIQTMRDLGRVAPLHYQEPFRRGFARRWEPALADYLADLEGAISGGAAGWCFHNGPQDSQDGDHRPRRSFDLRVEEGRLMDQLDEVERGLVRRLAERILAVTPQPARGPLRVHPTNPRYFTDGTRNSDGTLRAVYLTGSHTWNNQQEIEGFRPLKSPEPLTGKFDFDRFLDFLGSYHHNFYRHWIFEFAQDGRIAVGPHPWPRTGPGQARDGRLKFDLSKFDPRYFERLRSRVTAARERGIFVAIMLFESSFSQSAWQGHPFNRSNNIDGVDGGSMVRFHTLELPEVVRLQEAYVRQVVDTVNDLDNVVYEICNEPGEEAKDWGDFWCQYIKEYENAKRWRSRAKPQQHPVGMTAFFDKAHWSQYQSWIALNDLLFSGPYDWIAPGGWAKDPQASVWGSDPPANDGRNVVFLDPDHIWPVAPQRSWVWKCFMRGHQPILMDWYDSAPVWISGEEQEAMRQAMGHTRRLAERVNLAAMTPRNDLASTQYCLADPGTAYLVYLPDGGAVTVDLTAVIGTLAVQWIHPVDGTITAGGATAGGDKRQFEAPFGGDAVLCLEIGE